MYNAREQWSVLCQFDSHAVKSITVDGFSVGLLVVSNGISVHRS